MKITLASLDLFHLIDQAEQLERFGNLNSFWTIRVNRNRSIPTTKVHNALLFHYLAENNAKTPQMGGRQSLLFGTLPRI